MNRSTLLLTAGFVLLGGVVAYDRWEKHKADKAKMEKVKENVSGLIKDVPEFNKPSR